MAAVTKYAAAAAVLAAAVAAAAAWPRTTFDVIAVPASTGPVVREIVAQSTLSAPATVDVVAAVSGEVQALEVDEQTAVHTGDILARLDPAPFEEVLRAARSTLAYLRSSEDATSEQLADAERHVHAAMQALDRTIIRAPADGIVVVKNVSMGQIVTTDPGAAVLYRIATDLHHLQVAVEVAGTEVAAIRPNSDVRIALRGAPESPLHGTVARVGRTTIVDIANPDLRLRPGADVTATIFVERRDNVLRVPSEAFAFNPPLAAEPIVDAAGAAHGSAPELWRYDRGRLTPVAVRVGLSGDGWTEIDSGLEDGDEVATGVVARREHVWSAISFP